MRLLIVGSDKIFSIENFYVKYLREAGVDVFLFTSQNYFYEYYNKSLFNKVWHRASLSKIISKINDLFKVTVQEFNPDIIWVFKGMELLPESLLWAKRQNIKLVNYNPDNPFIFSGVGSGNEHITNSISIYDLHFTYNLAVKQRLENEYGKSTVFLPFGFELDEKTYLDYLSLKENLKLCFLGNPDRERADTINELHSAGIQVDVFGHNWNSFLKRSSVSINEPVYGKQFWKTLRQYRLQLNLMRPHNETSHNMRSFEVPATGGIMLAPDTPEHRLFFEDKKEVFLFNGTDQLIEFARRIKSMDKSESDLIRTQARERSLTSGYTYKDRAATALGELKKLLA